MIFYTYFDSQISMSVKTQVTILHVMNMPTALILRAVISVPATLDSLEMDSLAPVRNYLSYTLGFLTNTDNQIFALQISMSVS